MNKINTISNRKTPLILITDDDRSIRALLRLALQEDGYTVEEAVHGKDCLEKYSHLQPDLVLLDAVMPEMDGLTCCENLRSHSERQQVPILMITFLDDRESIDRAFAVGATDYITKPIHWSVLRQRIKRLLISSRISLEAEIMRRQILEQQAWELFWRELLQQSLPKQNILPGIITKAQEFFLAERIIFYPFNDSSLIESVAPGYPSVQHLSWLELGLEEYIQQYRQGQVVVINNLTQTQLSPAIVNRLVKQLGTQAILLIPVLVRQELHGVLCVHRAKADYHWQELEITRFSDLANLLALIVGT